MRSQIASMPHPEQRRRTITAARRSASQWTVRRSLPHLMADGSGPAGLDQCNGHMLKDGTYHYHVGEAGSNAILGCLTAQAGCTQEGEAGACDASARRPRP